MKFKSHVDKLTGMTIQNFYPLDTMLSSFEWETKRTQQAWEIRRKLMPVMLESLVTCLTAPEASGRVVVITDTQLIPGALTSDEIEYLFSQTEDMLHVIRYSQEYASRVNGFWLMVKDGHNYLFVRVSDNPDTSVSELIKEGAFYTPPQQVRPKKKKRTSFKG